MKIIKSYFVQFLAIFISGSMFFFSIFASLYIDDGKYLSVITGIVLGIIFLIISSFRIEYDDCYIWVRIFVLRKKIRMENIIKIDYSGLPGVYDLKTDFESFYIPAMFCRKKIRILFEHLKSVNPDIEIIKRID